MTQNYLSYSYGYAEFMNQPQYQNEKPSPQASSLLYKADNIFKGES